MKQAKPVGTTAHILMGILVFGSIWGCLEATLGSALHLIYFPHTGAIMAGIGCSIMGMALAMYRKPALPMGIGLVAASLKWLDVPLLHMSPLAQVIVNPAMAIVMESLAFSLVATLLMKKMEESIPPRIVAGALAGCLGSVAFVFSAAYLTRFPCWVEAGLAGQLEFIATDGTIWGVVSAILLPFGYGVGRKVQPAMAYARRAKPWFNYAGSAATVLLSISLLLGSISSQSQGRIVALSSDEGNLGMVVNGELVKTYTLDELSDKPTVLVTCPVGNKEVEAIPLTDLLTEIGIDPEDVESFTALASDGYSVEIDGEEIENAYIKIVDEECIDEMGYLRLIVPELHRSKCVHHLVEIEFELT